MNNVRITLPDGGHFEMEPGSTVMDAVSRIGPGLGRAALAAKLNGAQVDLDHRLNGDAALEVLTFNNPEGREVYWHSTTHLMARRRKSCSPKPG